MLNRLPTKVKLKKRGMTLNPRESVCVICFKVEENLDHLLFSCPITVEVLCRIRDFGYQYQPRQDY